MVRFIAQNSVTTPEQLKAFAGESANNHDLLANWALKASCVDSEYVVHVRSEWRVEL